MIAARLLVELGCNPADALNRVRAARPGSIATAEQEKYVHRQRAVPEPYEGMQLALLDEDQAARRAAAKGLVAATTAAHLQGLPSQLVRSHGVASAADSE